jgi:hypothetical protein
VELDDGLLLLEGEAAALDVRAEVVGPPQPAALPAPRQPCRKINYSRSSSLLPMTSEIDRGKRNERLPAFLGRARQLPCPCLLM